MINSNRPPKATSSKKRATRAELNAKGREQKQKKKHRGHASGSRTQVESHSKQHNRQKVELDPRIGSKTPVPLVVNAPEKVTAKAKIPSTKNVEPTPQISAEEELQALEQDARLDALLERLEQGETLNKEEQLYVDSTLDRIDLLMEQLGISLDDETPVAEEDMMQLLRRNDSKNQF